MAEKEPWSYGRFCSAYNELASGFGEPFILGEHESEENLQLRYESFRSIRAVREFAELVFAMEQGELAEELHAKYK